MPDEKTPQRAPKPATSTLTADQRVMLEQIRQIDVREQRSFAGIQSKISLIVLAIGVAVSLFIEDNWHLVLIIAVSISFLFFVVSRAKYGFCELQELIQTLDRQEQETDERTASE